MRFRVRALSHMVSVDLEIELLCGHSLNQSVILRERSSNETLDTKAQVIFSGW